MGVATLLATEPGSWHHRRVSRDRLETALRRKPGGPGPFIPIPYPNALAIATRQLASVRERHGDDAIGLLAATAIVEASAVDLRIEPGREATLVAAVLRLAVGPAIDADEVLRQVRGGAIKALVSIGYDHPLSAADERALDGLEFHLAVDSVLGGAARHAHIVLPLHFRLDAGDDRPGSHEEGDEPFA